LEVGHIEFGCVGDAGVQEDLHFGK
jgi:hypothetical protein